MFMHVPKSVSEKHEFRTSRGVYSIILERKEQPACCCTTILSCRARIFYPGQYQVDDSGHDPSPPNKKRKINSTEESSITSVHHETTIL